MLPLVSIITPSYNQGKFIDETIKSVLNQDYENIEYIIIDGCSTDNTLEIVKKYDGKLKFISEKDEGQADAINKGLKMAKGEIVAWINSDDTYEKGAIRTAVEYFETNPDIALIYGEAGIINEEGAYIRKFEATRKFDLWTLIHVSDFIMQPTTFFKKKAIEEVGYLDKNLYWTMDWDLWIKLGKRYQVGYVDKLMANTREYPQTKTSTGGFKRIQEISHVMRRHGNMKYPPGYFLYFFAFILTSIQNIKLLRILGGKFIAALWYLIFSKLPIITEDGWIGKKLDLAVQSGMQQIIIKGNVIHSSILPLKIKVIVKKNRMRLVQKLVYMNEESFTIQLPENESLELQFVSLKVKKYLIENKYRFWKLHRRKLSWHVDRIEYK